MSSVQITANRANAKLSTGPVTPEGKAKVALNRLSHGLAGRFRLLADEAQQEYDALSNALAEEYEPQTPTDFYYLNEAIQNMWRRQRAATLEAAMFMDAAFSVSRLDVILRYANSARRAVERALKHLSTAKAARQTVEQQPVMQIGFESQTTPEPPDSLPASACETGRQARADGTGGQGDGASARKSSGESLVSRSGPGPGMS